MFLLIFTFITGTTVSAEGDVFATVLADTPEPQVSSVGGEWAVIALARTGYAVPEGYYDSYADKAAEFIQNGSARKYTDYARVLLALTAIGADTFGAEKYLENYDAVTAQGINGVVYALIALDCGGYESSKRDDYVDFILKSQHGDGGFGLTDSSDADVTAMAVQALAAYRERTEVDEAVTRALAYLDSVEITTCEGAAQCVIAYCALGIKADKYYDELMKYYNNGHFVHIIGGGADAMATEQGALAEAAMGRYIAVTAALYDMRNVPIKDNDSKADALAACARIVKAVILTGFAVTGVLWKN